MYSSVWGWDWHFSVVLSPHPEMLSLILTPSKDLLDGRASSKIPLSELLKYVE